MINAKEARAIALEVIPKEVIPSDILDFVYQEIHNDAKQGMFETWIEYAEENDETLTLREKYPEICWSLSEAIEEHVRGGSLGYLIDHLNRKGFVAEWKEDSDECCRNKSHYCNCSTRAVLYVSWV
jgi:hypothetical protein